MECPKCQCQDGEYKSGISKKNGKPWRAWKCSQCGEFVFQKTEASAPLPLGGNEMARIATALEEIKVILLAKFEVGKPVLKKAKKVIDEPPIEDTDEEVI